MKLNYRDKVILTTVIVIIVWVIGIMLFIKPAIEEVNVAQGQLDEAKVTLSDLENQIEVDKNLQQRINEAYASVAIIAGNFYDYQVSQDASQTVENLLKTDDLENSELSISSYSTTVFSPYQFVSSQVSTEIDTKVDAYESSRKEVSADATTETTEAVAGDVSIGSYSISVKVTGTMENIENFCEKLTSNTEKSLVLRSLVINDVTEDTVSADMTLNMMVLKKLSDPNASAS